MRDTKKQSIYGESINCFRSKRTIFILSTKAQVFNFTYYTHSYITKLLNSEYSCLWKLLYFINFFVMHIPASFRMQKINKLKKIVVECDICLQTIKGGLPHMYRGHFRFFSFFSKVLCISVQRCLILHELTKSKWNLTLLP